MGGSRCLEVGVRFDECSMIFVAVAGILVLKVRFIQKRISDAKSNSFCICEHHAIMQLHCRLVLIFKQFKLESQ